MRGCSTSMWLSKKIRRIWPLSHGERTPGVMTRNGTIHTPSTVNSWNLKMDNRKGKFWAFWSSILLLNTMFGKRRLSWKGISVFIQFLPLKYDCEVLPADPPTGSFHLLRSRFGNCREILLYHWLSSAPLRDAQMRIITRGSPFIFISYILKDSAVATSKSSTL